MTDRTTLPALGEALTTENAKAIRNGDLVWGYLLCGRTCFGVVDSIEDHERGARLVLQNEHPWGLLTHFFFVGRPGRDGWARFNGETNLFGNSVVEVRLATGAMMRRRADHFPEVAWRAVITHVRPYVAPPIPSVETVERAIAALAPFAAVVASYSEAEDGDHEIWTDRGAIGGPDRTVFRLENYRAAAAALEALTGRKRAQS